MMLKNSYNWQYVRVGGVARVKIACGEDIAHIGELDQKMWTVLSCPTDGLDFDSDTLKMLDADGDGKIKVPEVVAAATWLTSVVKDRDSLLKESSEISLDNIDDSTPEGKALVAAAVKILSEQGLPDKKSISIEESSRGEATLKYLNDCRDYVAWMESADDKVMVFGDRTQAAYSAYLALKDKASDFFMRCALVAFNGNYSAAVDVSAEKLGEISDRNLAQCPDIIAGYPLAKPVADGILNVDEVNPAWKAKLLELMELTGLGAAELSSEAGWAALGAGFHPYEVWIAAKKGADVEALGLEKAREEMSRLASRGDGDIASIREVNKLTHYYKYFYRFLRNYVVFDSFYDRSSGGRAAFEAGELYIDQRCCHLCIRVSDMNRHTEMPALSRMFLIYCHCKSKVKAAEMDIVAVMTAGTASGLRVGRNALFYDRSGHDWDAVVVKIVKNPISVSEAFWTPYIRFGEFCSNLINKSAENKDKQVMAEMEGKATDISAAEDKSKVQAFDIAKFAGIFAALGMGLGLLADALVGLMKGIMALKLWQLAVLVVLIMLVISGPSCFLAWRKLRKRNLGPVLNANGWVINSRVLVNVLFGKTLTSAARYPRMKVRDPYARRMKWWQKLLLALLSLAVAGFLVLYLSDNLQLVGIELHRDDVVNTTNSIIDDFNSSLQNAAQVTSAEVQDDSTKIKMSVQ